MAAQKQQELLANGSWYRTLQCCLFHNVT